MNDAMRIDDDEYFDEFFEQVREARQNCPVAATSCTLLNANPAITSHLLCLNIRCLGSWHSSSRPRISFRTESVKFLLRLSVSSLLLNRVWSAMRDMRQRGDPGNARALSVLWREVNHFTSAVEEHVRLHVSISCWKRLCSMLDFSLPSSVNASNISSLPTLSALRAAHADYISTVSSACFVESPASTHLSTVFAVAQHLYQRVVLDGSCDLSACTLLERDFRAARAAFFRSLKTSTFHARKTRSAILARLSLNGYYLL